MELKNGQKVRVTLHKNGCWSGYTKGIIEKITKKRVGVKIGNKVKYYNRQYIEGL